MSENHNPYEPATPVELQCVDETQGDTPIDRYPMSWKIAALVGLASGYRAWFEFTQFYLMSRPVSWMVQGGSIAIGLLPASVFFRVRDNETTTQSIVQSVLPSALILAIWSVAALAELWIGREAAMRSWSLTFPVVAILDLVLIKANRPTQSRRMAMLFLVIYCIAMIICLVGLFL